MLLEKAKIYGVDGIEGANPSLKRTDNAVGLSFKVGTSEIHSDFDNCYPWSEMREEVDEHGNVFIRVPKFYSKYTVNGDGTRKLQISGVRYAGFSTLFVDGKGHEIDYVLIGKYEGSGNKSQIFSKSGQTVLVSTNIVDYRNGCRANGEGYQQYDLLIDAIIKQLFMIEFATTNCQSIMYGYAYSNSAAVSTGRTDDVATPSGSPTSNTTGKFACKYRGIENPWGNVYKWCDGISFQGKKVYICLDPESYQSEYYEMPYIYVGDRSTDDEFDMDGYLKSIKYFDKFPLLGYHGDGDYDASDSTYYCDYIYDYEGGTVLSVGGRWDGRDGAGLWYGAGGDGASLSDSVIGGRLCKKPLLERD